MEHLTQLGYSALCPEAVRIHSQKGQNTRHTTRLIPGYVFFDAATEPTPSHWTQILKASGVLKALHYHDGSYALRHSDLKFVDWLKQFNGLIEVSRVITVGAKLVFVDGPLKELNGEVVQVNKKRRSVAVRFGTDQGLFQTVWCSFDYVESAVEEHALPIHYAKPQEIAV